MRHYVESENYHCRFPDSPPTVSPTTVQVHYPLALFILFYKSSTRMRPQRRDMASPLALYSCGFIYYPVYIYHRSTNLRLERW